MRIDDLRETLHEHGGEVEGHAPATRVQEVHGRIRTARRRRSAGVAAGTVAAVATVALTVVPNLQPNPAPAPATPDLPADYTKDGVTFRGEVLGERLLGAAIGEPGQSTVSFDFVIGEKGLRFSPTCHGAGPDRAVIYAVEGDEIGSVTCSKAPDPDPGAGGMTFEAPPEKLRIDWGLQPGDTATMTVRLVSSRDSDGPTVEDPQTVIGAGVYEDTRATQVVSGVEVPKRIEHEGRVWEMASTYESDPGKGDIKIWSDQDHGVAEDQVTILALSGLRGRAAYDVLVDGEVVDGAQMDLGQGSPTWQIVQEVERGTVYELEARVTEGLADRTRLAFVHYWPAD